LEEVEEAEEISGKINFGSELMHSVLENDRDKIEKGRILEEAMNQGIGIFTPDTMFENLVRDYKLAKQIYGDSLLELLTGYDPKYIEKNIKIPEFQKELRKKIDEKIDELRDDEFIDKNNSITEKGIEMSSLVLYMEEVDKLIGKGLAGEKLQKKSDMHGIKQDVKNYRRGDRYKDMSVHKSVKTAVRRQHKSLILEDLKTFERQAKGRIEIVYALDASSSMKGLKIRNAKKAGIALSFKAIEEKDKVGLIIFGTEVQATVLPTHEFGLLLKEITKIRARGQTNLAETIKRAVEFFSDDKNITRHLVILTDALPTVGEKPEKETLDAVGFANSSGITVSIVGINIDEKGAKLAKQIAELGQGRFYTVKDVEELDRILLLDYYSV
jgi:Mg-chelatase subunit ChlD